MEQRGYSLHTTDEYAGLLEDAGFRQVDARDVTNRFIEILRKEMTRIESLPLSRQERDKLRHDWHQKLARAEAGYQRWGIFSARV